jgi:hypothetical protein
MDTTTEPGAERPPYLWAALTALAILALYAATLAPTTAFWDTSEYIAAARVLGIPHPPGNPLFVLMAHVWGLIPLGEYAARINLFAAATSAASAGLFFLVAERWLRSIVPLRPARLAAAFAGVLVGAAAWTVWNQSAVNEKVYTVSLLSIALVLWLTVRWGDQPEGSRHDRWLVLIAYVLALTSTNHLMGVLAAPAVAVYVLWTDWRVITRPWAVAAAATLLVGFANLPAAAFGGSTGSLVAMALLLAAPILYAALSGGGQLRQPLFALAYAAPLVGVSVNYLFLPIRAGQFPPINEGEPVGFFSDALREVLERAQYAKPSVFDRQADLLSQFANYFQYWKWQFAFDWPELRAFFAVVFIAIGLLGVVVLWRRDARAAAAAIALQLTVTVALVYYLNFKYGFSMLPEQPELPREVRERDYFFMASFATWGLFVALGFGAMMRWIVDFLQTRGSVAGRWAAASPVLALALIPLLGNRVTATRAGETIARDFAIDLLESVEPYGILITAGDNDTFPLWYAQEVEGIRQDVTVANLSLMNTRWHLRQLQRRETPAFEPEASIALWREIGETTPWVRPATPVFSVSLQELDSLPEVMRVPQESGLRFDSLMISFGQDYLMLQDLATIFLIRDNLGQRAIHFSWSTGNYPDQTLRLTPYLVAQGLVRKLVAEPIVPNDSIVLSEGLGYFDVPRSRALMGDVYRWEGAARDRPRGWTDTPSSSILQLYALTYRGAASTFAAMGDTTFALKADSIGREILEQVDRRPARQAAR